MRKSQSFVIKDSDILRLKHGESTFAKETKQIHSRPQSRQYHTARPRQRFTVDLNSVLENPLQNQSSQLEIPLTQIPMQERPHFKQSQIKKVKVKRRTSLTNYIEKIKAKREKRDSQLEGHFPSASFLIDRQQQGKRHLHIHLKPSQKELITPPMNDQKQVVLTTIKRFQDEMEYRHKIEFQSNLNHHFSTQAESEPLNNIVSTCYQLLV